jgi:hypothetical protein
MACPQRIVLAQPCMTAVAVGKGAQHVRLHRIDYGAKGPLAVDWLRLQAITHQPCLPGVVRFQGIEDHAHIGLVD